MARKKISALEPQAHVRPYSTTRDYKYFWGHSTREVISQLPQVPVKCWFTGEELSVPVCATSKFLQEEKHCKRCPLFQEDELAKKFRALITKWEQDEVLECK